MFKEMSEDFRANFNLFDDTEGLAEQLSFIGTELSKSGRETTGYFVSEGAENLRGLYELCREMVEHFEMLEQVDADDPLPQLPTDS